MCLIIALCPSFPIYEMGIEASFVKHLEISRGKVLCKNKVLLFQWHCDIGYKQKKVQICGFTFILLSNSEDVFLLSSSFPVSCESAAASLKAGVDRFILAEVQVFTLQIFSTCLVGLRVIEEDEELGIEQAGK